MFPVHDLMEKLFPICRSLTGDGVRETLAIIGEQIPLSVHEVPSGTQCFDWTVPDEWNIRDAYVKDGNGNRLVDFRKNNLHVLGYSEPVEGEFTLDELQGHLFTHPDLSHAIPYLTSYYAPRWGFCLSQDQLNAMGPGPYQVKIDSTLRPGSLTYADLLIPGDSEQEILLSTYICHPSMANNELSGPAVTTELVKWLQSLTRRRYSYRIVFAPETLGAICYLFRNFETMKRNTIAGYVITCVGGPGRPTYIQTRQSDALVDRISAHVLAHCDEDANVLSYAHRGSDERQYGSPGVDLPVGSLARTLHGDFPEYHSSLDNLEFVTEAQLERSLALYKKCITAIEANIKYRVKTTCEPQLGKRGLYPTLGSDPSTTEKMAVTTALIGYCDGTYDLLKIAEAHGWPVWALYDTVNTFVDHGLLEAAS